MQDSHDAASWMFHDMIDHGYHEFNGSSHCSVSWNYDPGVETAWTVTDPALGTNTSTTTTMFPTSPPAEMSHMSGIVHPSFTQVADPNRRQMSYDMTMPFDWSSRTLR
ncbi:hypothetical protein LIA77_06167 [Sarocladium implicatum]|nr:hypothetical protein LIA77_06167 [Sarocladium implicatum]